MLAAASLLHDTPKQPAARSGRTFPEHPRDLLVAKKKKRSRATRLTLGRGLCTDPWSVPPRLSSSAALRSRRL